mmetsp:Transcript_22872/g.54766  ORF Transcript_22872/g.54766 Transcript_22872/m.54766 type:complete len:253 (-) Transcript_22872:147-905(-)
MWRNRNNLNQGYAGPINSRVGSHVSPVKYLVLPRTCSQICNSAEQYFRSFSANSQSKKRPDFEKHVQRVVREKRLMGHEAEVFSDRMKNLAFLVPDVLQELQYMDSSDVLRLAESSDVVETLIELKTIFPHANVSSMLVRSVRLASLDHQGLSELRDLAGLYCEALPGMSPEQLQKLFEIRPHLLDPKDQRYGNPDRREEEIVILCREAPWLDPDSAGAVLDAKREVLARIHPSPTSIERMVVRRGAYGWRG